jgi:hypothetical protein
MSVAVRDCLLRIRLDRLIALLRDAALTSEPTLDDIRVSLVGRTQHGKPTTVGADPGLAGSVDPL